MKRFFRSIKYFLPQGLFWRSVLLLALPLIISELVGSWVFYDRFWTTVMHRMSMGVATNIAMVVDNRDFRRHADNDLSILAIAGARTGLDFKFTPDGHIADPSEYRSSGKIKSFLEDSLVEQRLVPYHIGTLHRPYRYDVDIQLPEGVLSVTVPRNLIYTSMTYVFLAWMVGTAFLTFAIAIMFLRNQVRALRRLATAAEAFGMGREVPHFKPEGASEVRRAATAFMIMRERIQRQISQRTEMLAGVSHDLRTPLTRMKLELELVGDSEDIRGLKSDVVEMQQMVEGYLSFARGEGDETPQVTDLVERLRDVVASSNRLGTQISLSAPDELHMPLRRDGFRRCVVNLIDNASRYGGHVWVTVMANRPVVDITIDDDGPGIPEAMREAVFRPFYRLEGSRNVSTGGIGLGLTIARDVARGMGGDLLLETSPHGGLRAHIRLPR